MKHKIFHKLMASILLLLSTTSQLRAQELLITEGTYMLAQGAPWITLLNASWTDNGGLYGGFAAGDSKVAIKRNSGPDIYLRGSNKSYFHHLIVNAGDGVFRVAQDAYIYARWDFGGNMISIGDHDITLGPAAVLGSDNLETQFTGNNGRIMITLPLNAPFKANPGNLGLEITSVSNLGSTTIIRGFREQINAAGEKSIMRYYDVLPANQPSRDTKISLQFSNTELNGNAKEKLAIFAGQPGSRLKMLGKSENGLASNWVSAGNVDKLQRFTLGNAIASSAPDLGKNNVTVYPNPFRDRFTISIRSSTAQKAELRIINLSGAVVERKTVQLNVGINLIEWSTAGYLSGTYYLITDNETFKSIKILKQ